MRSQLAGRYVIMPLRAVVDSDAFSREHLDASLLLGSVGDGKTVLDIHQVTGMHAELCNLWKRQAFTTEDSHQRNPAVRRDPHLSVTRKISSLGAAPKTTTFKEYTCCIVMEMAVWNMIATCAVGIPIASICHDRATDDCFALTLARPGTDAKGPPDPQPRVCRARLRSCKADFIVCSCCASALIREWHCPL